VLLHVLRFCPVATKGVSGILVAMSDTYPPSQEDLPLSNADSKTVDWGVWIPFQIWTMEIGPTPKMLWATIRSLSKPNKPCFASNEWLAERMQVGERQIRRMLADLRELGLIHEVGFDGRRRLLMAVCPAEVMSGQTGKKGPGGEDENVRVARTKMSGIKNPSYIQENKAENKAEIKAQVPPIPPEGGLSVSGSDLSSPTGKPDSGSIEEIYQAYPLKVGKPAALKAIQKALKKYPFETLLEKTKQFAAVRNGDLAFCPHPSTWFNQERFNDSPDTWKRSQGAPKQFSEMSAHEKRKAVMLK
jgi:hypothetical protein